MQVTSLHIDEEFESVSRFFVGSGLDVTLRIFSPTICEQRLRAKG